MAKPFRTRRWRSAMPDPAACWLIARELDVSPVVAQLLFNRGLTTPESAHAFLTAGRSQILDPFLLTDMDRAVTLIQERIAANGPIMVYGDYDVDGVTGTAILVQALRALGATVDYYIPDRFLEGYGLNEAALKDLSDRGHQFIVSVDTGITAVSEAAAARRLGMTLVVSDHHEPGPVLPDAAALVNPKRADCAYPFKGLSGVGVAFKLALALQAPNAWDLLDIVALGTIADMVPLVGENRAIVREGLAVLGACRRPGLRALMEVAGVREPVTATHIGFALGPRINALGRMGNAMAGVELLLTDDDGRARELARHLDEENRSRREVEAAILEQALEQARNQAPHEREYVLVLAGEGWHHGVVGICASRVLEAFHRPAILLSIDGDEVRGSARSIPTFHMQRALLQVSDLFVKFGGHAAAAGMTLRRREDVPVLRERLNRLAAEWLQPEDLVPELQIDAELGLDQVSDQLLAELRRLEPHGIGNPQPVFAARGLTAVSPAVMGKEQQHLRLTLRPQGDGLPLEAVGWGMAPARPADRAEVQAAFVPEFDTYQGRNRLRLRLHDLQAAAPEAAGSGPAAQPAPALVTAADCSCWDPLADLDKAPAGAVDGAVDARGERLALVFAQLALPLPEVATAGDKVAEPDTVVPSRSLYIQTLAAPADSRVLALTASPWSAAALAAELEQAGLRNAVSLWRPGQPEPGGGRVVVAAYGCRPAQRYSDAVLYHPPLHQGHWPAGRLHLLWLESDWTLAEAALGWPYPDREVLVQLYRLLKAETATAESLAAGLKEPPGPWNQLRFEAACAVLQELGLLDLQGRRLRPHNGGKLELETSARYRRGSDGRSALADLRRMIGLHGVTQYNEV